MFCTNCGSQVADSSIFCTNCGAKIQNKQDQLSTNTGSDFGQPNTQNYTGQPFQSQTFGGQPVMAHSSIGMNAPKSKTSLFIAMGAAGVVGLVIIIFIFSRLLGGVNSSPEKVVRNFFKAVSTQDGKLMLKTIYFEDEEERQEFQDDIEDTEEELENLDEMFKDELGKNWINKLDIEAGKTKNVNGQTVVTVEVTANVDDEDETLSIKVIKENGKYYIDPVSLNMLY
ncbi:zinc-ribbon domain-containing protein [Clostridium thermarum]|uniref:zinc-ribbon domain-containing protein n=1 Tax=Clostridium thermarum TaxID=1716543 RepID=UPI0013D43291|nr:zinc-ribbon domain-containing protein [Clostridium thermarum]